MRTYNVQALAYYNMIFNHIAYCFLFKVVIAFHSFIRSFAVAIAIDNVVVVVVVTFHLYGFSDPIQFNSISLCECYCYGVLCGIGTFVHAAHTPSYYDYV